MTKPGPNGFPRYSLREIREKVERFRSEHWPQGTVPVDIEMILERAGYVLEPIAGMKEECDLVACIAPDARTISVDQQTMLDQKQYFFYRSSLAHELGHAVLHRGFLEWQRKQGIRTIQEWAAFVHKCHDDPVFGWFDSHAWEFAGGLLVPRARLEEEVQKAKARIPKRYLKQVQRLPSDVMHDYIASAIYRLFEVNVPLIKSRLRKERL